ncbi:hypothetical protein D3C73_1257330 [compost metagenome]
MRHFRQQKAHHVIGNLLAERIGFIRRTAGIGQVRFHQSDDFFRVYLDALAADAIHGMKNGDAVTTRRRAWYHNVGQFRYAWIVIMIQLNNDFFRP